MCGVCFCFSLPVDNLYLAQLFSPLDHFLQLLFTNFWPYYHFHHSLSPHLSMTFLSIPTSHPLPAALSRSSVLHDMSEDAFEHCTPVMVLSPAKDSGKKQVKQKPRRRRRASERYEHSEKQLKGRKNDFHLQISSPRWRELYTDSSDSSSTDESHWNQARRRAQVKLRLSRRRRNSNKSCGNLAGSSNPKGIELIDLGSKGEQHQEMMECESCSLNLCRGKLLSYHECSASLPRGPVEMKPPSKNQERNKGRFFPQDPKLLHSLRQNQTIKKRLSEVDSSTETLAATEDGKHVDDAGLQVHSSVPQPPAACDDGSDHVEVCRSVTTEKGSCQMCFFLL